MNDNEMKDYKDLEEEIEIFKNLKNIKDIFNFDFLSLFLSDENITYINLLDGQDWKIRKKFKNAHELFNQKKIIEKLNYFYLEILYGVEVWCGSAVEKNNFLCQHLFTKTKNEKYTFMSFFQYNSDGNCGDGSNFKFIQKNKRICNDRNYNNYFYINKEMIVEGWGKTFINDKLIEEDFNVNAFRMFDNNYNESIMEFLYLLNEFKNDNKLEMIEFDFLDIRREPKFFDNLTKFRKLRVFKNNKGLLLKNKQLIELLKCLSECEYLFLIDICFEKTDLNLNEKEKKDIYKLFPDISIQKSRIIWRNNEPKIKIE